MKQFERVRALEEQTKWGGDYRSSYIRQVKIGDKWSYGDWGLYLADKPDIAPAAPKLKLVEIPASDGSLDLSEVLTGEPIYDDRVIKFALVTGELESSWNYQRLQVENYCHGRRMQVSFPEDTEHYFIGRLQVKSFDKDNIQAFIRIEMLAEAYRYKNELTRRELVMPSSGALTTTFHNEHRCVYPSFTANAETKISFEQIEATIPGDEKPHQITSIAFTAGKNTATFTSTSGAKIEVEYQEASL
jgi:hypothetical protein